jgi:hypothetical protein
MIDVCTQRANLPVALPHCAICARYSTDNLPFEAILALLEVVPESERAEAVRIAMRGLKAVPAAIREQQVTATTLPVLFDTPGWPLVRSLVIDMADQSIAAHFDDPRLGAIEEITLLGFAYGGCEISEEFAQRLFNSSTLKKVRELKLHSMEASELLSKSFWPSGMARRLKIVSGIPYFGETIRKPLKLQELGLSRYHHPPEGLSLRSLLDPKITPELTQLTTGAFFEGIEPFLKLLTEEKPLFERLKVSLGFSDFRGEESHRLGHADLPESVETITWNSQFNHVSVMNIRTHFDHHTLYDRHDEKVEIRFGDRLTHYGAFVFDWNLRNEISQAVHELALLLPLEIDLEEVIDFVAGFEKLQGLTLVYPFSKPEIEKLLRVPQIRKLEALNLWLSVSNGQFDMGKNQYMQKHNKKYRSAVPEGELFAILFGESTRMIPHLSIATQTFDISRSAGRVQHCSLMNANALAGLIESKPTLPFESLTFDLRFVWKPKVTQQLVESSLLSRLYRLALRGKVDPKSAAMLMNCESLKTVRSFDYCAYVDDAESIRIVLNGTGLTGAWDIDFYLPMERDLPGIEQWVAESSLLNSVVCFNYSGSCSSPFLPQSGKLARVRRLGEGIAHTVLGDGRVARLWQPCPLGRPLKARIEKSLALNYGLQPTQTLEELSTQLKKWVPFEDEEGFQNALRSLLILAFDREPIPEGTPFKKLNAKQKQAVRLLAKLNETWWSIGGLVRDVTLSYGLSFWDQAGVEGYIAGRSED